jgi:hypothetical protein
VTGWGVLRFGCTNGSRYSGLYDLLSSIPPCVGLGFGIVVREYSSILRLDFDAFCKLFSGYRSMQAGMGLARFVFSSSRNRGWWDRIHAFRCPRRAYPSEQSTCCVECGHPDLVRIWSALLNFQWITIPWWCERLQWYLPRERHLVSTFRIHSLVIPPCLRLPTCPTPEPPSSRRCSP